MINQKQNKWLDKFSPLIFLSSLGAGGISVAFFAILNYGIEHGKGLIYIVSAHNSAWNHGLMQLLLYILEIGMLFFGLFSILLTIIYFKKLILFLKSSNYQSLLHNPLANSAILAPFISITMTLNVFLASFRYFIPQIAQNLQAYMLAGLIVWAIIWLALMRMEIKLLKISFLRGFDVNKIHFGWLLHPFALGMVTVTGSGIAALAKIAWIADLSFFMLAISGSMGLFLLLVKSVAIFKSHFAAEGLPDKQFLPSLLIVIPNVTLYAITFFRLGHYLEHHYATHLHAYFMLVMVGAFAFETWYLAFGISMLKDYFRHHLKKEFHVSQWGLVCPFVAYTVIGAFVYKVFFPHYLMLIVTLVSLSFTVWLFSFLFYKQQKCQTDLAHNLECE